jgi:hypothetical protein
MLRVASFSANGVLAGRAVVAVVALALEGFVDAAAEGAVVALFTNRTVRTAPSGVTSVSH